MARLPRLVVADQPHHVIQRGIAGQPLFRDDEDRRTFLEHLAAASAASGLVVHAYVLLDDEVQLLATPREPTALSRAVQGLGRRYVAAFNRRHQRSGTLWEGRFRAGVVEAPRYFLACMLYVETAPVRAGCVASAADWPWSSAAHHVGRQRDALIGEHAQYWALGNTPFERELAWSARLEQGLGPHELQLLAHAARHGWALGSEAFLATLAAQTTRPLRPRPRGRPPKR